jgi:hypothetical protein
MISAAVSFCPYVTHCNFQHTPNTSILDFAHSPNICYSIHKSFSIPPLVSDENVAFRNFLRRDYGVEVAVTQPQRFFDKYLFVILECENCVGGMKASSITQKNRVNFYRCAYLFRFGSRLRNTVSDFQCAML